MAACKLGQLTPRRVFQYFEEICAIPHGSGNTKQISDYLVSFAVQNGLRYVQDADNNVLLFAEGTAGREAEAPVILQGHIDMVCEKDADCPIDMAREGLRVDTDGAFVFARGTTLGGDDGIAVAFAMALLTDDSVSHPPLEIVLTVDEETGMHGAAAVDLSGLRGRRLINLDAEEEGVCTVSCAGGVKSTVQLPFSYTPATGTAVRLTVSGLLGGHSGTEIHLPRANSNKALTDLLQRIQENDTVRLCSFSGGTKDNAIPRRSEAVVLVSDGAAAQTAAQAAQTALLSAYDEPQARVTAEVLGLQTVPALTAADSQTVLSFLAALPNGVIAESSEIEGLVETSLNLGVAALDANGLSVTLSVRSSKNEARRQLADRVQALAQQYAGVYKETGAYPAWEYREHSPLRQAFVQSYTALYGAVPRIAAIHAGLECGLFCEKIPDLDCISIGPQMYDIHTSRERLDAASVARTWDLLCWMLARL